MSGISSGDAQNIRGSMKYERRYRMPTTIGAAILALALLLAWFEVRRYMQKSEPETERKCCVTDWTRILEITKIEKTGRKK